MKKIEAGHRVSILRSVFRKEGPYAIAGETGVVIETFQSNGHKTMWSAKVRMDEGLIKTFRVTSLQRI